jgi:hypothetical protein
MNVDFKGRGCDVGDWSHMAGDRGHWCVCGNKRSGYTKVEKFLTN